MEMLEMDQNVEERQWQFISSMKGDMKVVFNRLDNIEANHKSLDSKLWMILMVVFAQLFAVVGGVIMFLVTNQQ